MGLSDYELYDREIERKWDENDRYDIIRRNLTDEVTNAVDLLNPFYRGEYNEKLLKFATRMEEIAREAEQVGDKF
jgi:hypothetical protein